MPEIKTVSNPNELPKCETVCATHLDNLLAACQRRGWDAPATVWHLSNASQSLWFAEQG